MNPSIPDSPYVYALADPGGTIFYIGKGRGRRMFAHARQAMRGADGGKAERIRSILNSGRKIEYIILGVYETDVDAAQAERQFISKHKNLCNLTKGGEIGGIPVDAKELLRRRAKKILNRLISCGNSDNPIAALLQKECDEPTPNMATWKPGIGVVFGWHCDTPIIHPACR